MTLCHVKSPPKVTASVNTLMIKSSDNVATAANAITDDDTAMTTDAITAGALYPNLEHAHGAYRLGTSSVYLFTPGVGAAPIAYFQTAGEIQSGGKIKITFPNDG